jgi:hypothetical protein
VYSLRMVGWCSPVCAYVSHKVASFKAPLCISHFSHACYTSRPCHPSRFHYYDDNNGRVQFINPLIMHLPPFSRYFLSPRSEIPLSTMFPNTVYSLLFAESERPSFTPIQASISDMFFCSCTPRGYVTVFVVGRIGKDTLPTPPMSMTDVATPL